MNSSSTRQKNDTVNRYLQNTHTKIINKQKPNDILYYARNEKRYPSWKKEYKKENITAYIK